MTAVDATTFGYAVLDTVGELCSNPLQRMSVKGTAKVLEENELGNIEVFENNDDREEK